MTIRLSPDRTDAVSAAIRKIGTLVHETSLAPDTEAARKALNAVWFAVHDAQQLLTEAERMTRREALAEIGEAA